MPVHQEAATIEATVREWFDWAERRGVAMRVVASEDGSTDGTVDALERLARELPVTVLHHGERLGYSRAVVAGVRSTDADLVCCVDSDGQCDPGDLDRLLSLSADAPLVVGRRTPRVDPWPRRAQSRMLRAWFRTLHGIALTDPSCPFLVGEGDLVRSLCREDPLLAQGWWWEFHVRASQRGVRVAEADVHHRPRADGSSRVYDLRSMPGIAASHVVGLWRLRDRACG